MGRVWELRSASRLCKNLNIMPTSTHYKYAINPTLNSNLKMSNEEEKWNSMLRDFTISPPESCCDARERVERMCISPEC